MSGRNGRARRAFRPLVVWALALMVLIGCGPAPTAIEPPQAPQGLTGVVLKASPGDLALTRSDMPAGFQLAAEKTLGPEYLALYLRPSALEEEESGGNKLLSVLTSVGVYTTTVAAEEAYLAKTATSGEQEIEEASMISAAATNVVTTPFEGVVQGADASEAYRVSYQLMDQNIYEYGHRFRVGNVLAYVVVAAVGNPNEPQHLLDDTRNLVQRQIDHIMEAADQAAP
jgi:hypothetical protein